MALASSSYARSENVRISNVEKVSLRDNNLDQTRRILLRYLCIYWYDNLYKLCLLIYLFYTLCNESFFYVALL